MRLLSLDRLLQSQGFGTRKWCRQLIADGEVVIDNDIIRDYRVALDPTGLKFSVFGEPWEFRAQVYIALHKPINIECSRKPSHHPDVLTLLPE